MKFRLTMNCFYAAFDGAEPQETASILRDLARRIEDCATLPDLVKLYDHNGNHVGDAVTTGRRAKRGA